MKVIDLRGDAAVYVHLSVAPSVCLHVDHDWRERARDGRRGTENLVNEFERAGAVACGDLRDVPDDRALGIKIHCSDEEEPPLSVLRSDLIEHVLGHILFDEVIQGCRIGHRISKNRREEVPFG